MKERPILFSSPMVRAILDGKKTQTRRIIKPQPEYFSPPGVPRKTISPGVHPYIPCPYGQPGDRLWVRETTYASPLTNLLTGEPTNAICGAYSADHEPVLNEHGFNFSWWYSKPLCPSIHMPRWASRILLEVTAVRVERLNDINEADALAEGVTFSKPVKPSHAERMARDAYAELWKSINGAGSWAANPWVWVIEFERVKGGA